MTIDDFIKELKQVHAAKRKLPLVIECPNGLLVDPKIKMLFKDGTILTKKAEVEKMVIAWQ